MHEDERVNLSPVERDFLNDFNKFRNIKVEVEFADLVFKNIKQDVSSNIQEENGVFYISENVLTTADAKNKDFKELVDSVIGSTAAPVAEQQSIFSDREVNLLDLGAAIGFDEPQGDNSGLKHEIINPLGINYDTYMSELNDFKMNITGISKSLLRVSQQVNALCAAIITTQGNKFKVEYSVGMDTKGRNLMAIKNDEPIYTQLMAKNAYLFIKDSQIGIEDFDNLIKKEERTHFRGYLYFPIIFQDQDAYLFAGLKTADKNLYDYIKILTKDLA